MAAQLYDIDILNYDMHKYIEIFKLLREFELLYDIEFFSKRKDEQVYFYCWIIARVQV